MKVEISPASLTLAIFLFCWGLNALGVGVPLLLMGILALVASLCALLRAA